MRDELALRPEEDVDPVERLDDRGADVLRPDVGDRRAVFARGMDDLHLAAQAVVDDAGGRRQGAARAVDARKHRVDDRHDGYDSRHGQQDSGNGLFYGGTPS